MSTSILAPSVLTAQMVSGFGQFHTNEPDGARPGKKLTPYATITWPDIIAMANNPSAVPKQNSQWFNPSILRSRSFRAQEADGVYWVLPFDFDHNTKPLESLAREIRRMTGDADLVAYLSRSATLENLKCRVLVPLAIGLSYEQYRAVLTLMNDALDAAGHETDRAMERAAQLVYLPNRGDMYDSCIRDDGVLFNPLDAMADKLDAHFEKLSAQKLATQAESDKRRAEAEFKRATMALNKYSRPIDAFNDAFTVDEILIEAGYDFDGTGNYRHPLSESGSFSASVKDGRVYSLSTSDPLYTANDSNGAHDAFSAYCELFHDGDQDKAITAACNERLMIGAESWNKVAQREHRRAIDQASTIELFDSVKPCGLKLKATEWIVEGFLSTGLTVIAGRAGGGKTSSLVSMFAQVAHLCPPDAMLRPALRRHIIYMAEDPEQIERCVYGEMKHGGSGLPEVEFLKWFLIVPSRRKSAEFLASTIRECNERYSYTLPNGFVVRPVMIADTASATIDLANENDNSEVGKAVATLKQSLNGMALVVVAHTAKGLVRADLSEMSPRGASAWAADANATVYAFEDPKLPNARFLGLGKHRFEPSMREVSFESETYAEQVQAPWGESQEVRYRVSTPMRSSAEMREQARQTARDEAEDARIAQQRSAVYDALKVLGAGEYLSKNELCKKLTGKKESLLADIDAMTDDGFIVQIKPSEPNYPQRHFSHKVGYVLPKDAAHEGWVGSPDDLV